MILVPLKQPWREAGDVAIVTGSARFRYDHDRTANAEIKYENVPGAGFQYPRGGPWLLKLPRPPWARPDSPLHAARIALQNAPWKPCAARAA